jgi:hypothetical protein
MRRREAEAVVEREERILAAELGRLREEPVPVVDVRAAVMARIAAADRISREEVSTVQLGGVALAVTAGFVVVAFGLLTVLPDVGALRILGSALGLAREVAGGMAAALVSLLVLPFEALGVVARWVHGFDPILASLRPVGIAGAAIGCSAIAATSVIVVGRDLMRGRVAVPREERG